MYKIVWSESTSFSFVEKFFLPIFAWKEYRFLSFAKNIFYYISGKIKLKDAINIEINTTSFVEYTPKENLDYCVDMETDHGNGKANTENVAAFTCEDCELVFK